MADETKSYDVLDLEGNVELIIATGQNLMPEKDWSRTSDNAKRARMTATAKTDIDANVDACQRDAMPDTAGKATISQHGSTFGVPAKGATQASGVDAGKVRGTTGGAWETTNRLTHKTGAVFAPTADGTVGAGGEAAVGIIAIEPGSTGRLSAGEILTWESTPAGLEDEVLLIADLSDGGLDVEGIGAHRTRILAKTSGGKEGGSASDWREWVRGKDAEDAGVAGIATAYVYPGRNGQGSVDVAALRAGSGGARLLDATDRGLLLSFLNGVRPIGATARVLEVIAQTQDIVAVVEPTADPLYGKDWDDLAPPEVLSWNAGTRTIVFTANRPASLKVGHRLVLTGTSGVELKVEAFAGADGVVIDDALGLTPAAGQDVYSGGPLIAPGRAAIRAYFDTLGPRLGHYGWRSFGDWDDTLRHSRIRQAINEQPGALDSEVTTPAADVEPTAENYLTDTQVNLLVPGNILLRYL